MVKSDAERQKFRVTLSKDKLKFEQMEQECHIRVGAKI